MGERTNPTAIPNWLQYDRYCRAFTTGIEYDLWDREVQLYRQMQTMERVPILTYGQSNLADVVFAFNNEIDKQLAQGSLSGKTFLFSLEGLPAAGKDYTGEKYVIPAIETHLERLRLKNPSVPHLSVLSWDATQDRLRAQGNNYHTSPGGTSTPSELVLTQRALEMEVNQTIRRQSVRLRGVRVNEQNGSEGEVVLVKLLSGTALHEPDGSWFEEPRKIYGDNIMENLLRRESVFRGIAPEDVIVARAALELGPWIQIWQYYRWIMLQTQSKNDADRYNALFHLPPFATEDEWKAFKDWQGGDPTTIGHAVRVANVTKNRMKRFGYVLPPDIPGEIFEDIHTVSELLGVDYDDVKEVCLTLLGHAMVHENNIRQSGVPEYLSAIIYNNPRLNLTPEQRIDLWAILKDLIIDEKGAAEDMVWET